MPLVTVIIPVFKGLELTLGCLDSVLADTYDDRRRQILVVNDASPDQALVDVLRRRAETGEFKLIEHALNLGFPAAVNSALAQTPEGDVVLLNADTEVAPRWLDKLSRAAYSRAHVGTVTPFSNNASICSLPFVDQAGLQVSLGTEYLDQAAERINPQCYVELPTGVGFCLYVTRDCLAAIGGLDAAIFGRGYGEETDFCCKALRKGFVHLLACDTYVYHHGQASFGSDEGDARRLAAESLIHRLHPSYPADLLRWLRRDPASVQRIALLFDLIRSSEAPSVLMVTHRIGGGVERHIQELGAVVQGRAWPLVLRPTANRHCMTLSLGVDKRSESLRFDLQQDGELLLQLLRALGVARLHVHHVVQVPQDAWALLDRLEVPMDLTLHDYCIVNGNPTLTNEQGLYQSAVLPAALVPRQGRADAQRLQDLARRAARCLVPTEQAGRHVRQWLPELVVQVHAHPDRELRGAYPSPRPSRGDPLRPFRVVCIGALGREKGVEVLRAVANLAANQRLNMEFVLIGSSHIPLGRNVTTSGSYDEADLQRLLAGQSADLVWFPVLWPETWSYTLSAALEAGLPILAADIGAFPERLLARPWSWLLTHRSSTGDWVKQLKDICQVLRAAEHTPGDQPWLQPAVEPFYTRSYLVVPPAREAAGMLPDAGQWASRCQSLFKVAIPKGGRGIVLSLALRVREWPLLGAVLAMVPYNHQRRIKRFLSRRPLH
ncbi:MAG: glycosyltransferase [Pseudomonas sp.]|uniref:glycosyltransferase n=1 Tax=Pseudomonas sp. TaxID=306 RepID=UPI0033982DAF